MTKNSASATVFAGAFHANTDGLLNRVASLGQGQVRSSIEEAIANAVDAAATTVHIVFVDDKGKRRIIIADNGHGILGWVPDDQVRVIKDYVNSSNSMDPSTAGDAVEKLFRELDPVYAMSFLFMCSSGALSAKSRPGFWNQAQQYVNALWFARARRTVGRSR